MLLRQILSKWLLPYRNKFLLEKKLQWEKELIPQQEAIDSTSKQLKAKQEELDVCVQKLTREQANADELIRRITDKRVDLERVNSELAVQIRLMESKASPSNIWAEAFSLGFSKAWDMMIPIMQVGVGNIEKRVKDATLDEVYGNLSGFINQRAKELLNGNCLPPK